MADLTTKYTITVITNDKGTMCLDKATFTGYSAVPDALGLVCKLAKAAGAAVELHIELQDENGRVVTGSRCMGDSQSGAFRFTISNTSSARYDLIMELYDEYRALQRQPRILVNRVADGTTPSY